MIQTPPHDICEGAFAQPKGPRIPSSYPTLPVSLAAGPLGVILGRFGWADLVAGQVNSTRQSALDRLGFVYPATGTWQKIYEDALGRRVLRAGLPVTVGTGGAFWVRFNFGALYGNQVYASNVDGSAISGPAAGAEPTPWRVVSDAGPGTFAIITTWSGF